VTAPFVHLDVRSFFSLKEGAFSPEALARRAAELQMPAVALADRDGLYGTARFVDASARAFVRSSARRSPSESLGRCHCLDPAADPRTRVWSCSHGTRPGTRTCAGWSPMRT
jgi:PHP domain